MRLHFLTIGVCLVAALVTAIARAEEPATNTLPKSVTVFPIVITPSEDIVTSFPERVAQVVGMLLERAGMKQVELSQDRFAPPESDDVAKEGEAFGEFVKAHPIETEYALFGHVFGTPKTGPSAVRTIVVDKVGNVVFTDVADRPMLMKSRPAAKDPMGISIYIANRLRPAWNLADPLRPGAPTGKLADQFRQQTGVPPREELAAMDQRFKTLQKDAANATITVYPVHLWTAWDKPAAAKLTELINKQQLCKAVAAGADPDFTVPGSPNEQKVLWDTAHAFSKFVRQHPPETEYALLVDYGLNPSGDCKHEANHVHVIVCNRVGELVLLDYQNSHHADFERIDPKTVDQCNELAVVRLKACLSR